VLPDSGYIVKTISLLSLAACVSVWLTYTQNETPQPKVVSPGRTSDANDWPFGARKLKEKESSPFDLIVKFSLH